MPHVKTQTLSIDDQRRLKIVLIHDLNSKTSSFYEDFSEEDEPCGKLSLNCGQWDSPSDEQEWRDDYYASIRL